MPAGKDFFGNPLPLRKIGEPSNNLPIDLYRRLLPRIQEEDQAAGAHGYVLRYDDPDSVYDSGDPLTGIYDAIGLSPVIQELFYVLETQEGEDVMALESIAALVDPLRCPEEMLHKIAASFGYQLQQDLGASEGISDIQKRTALLGLIDAFRARGTFVGFKVFYRLIGFEVINVYELWKANINEADEDYSRVRYQTVPAAGIFIGPAGVSSFAGTIPETPIKPGTLRITADTGGGPFVLRDDPIDDTTGSIIGPNGETGTVNYATGVFTMLLAAPSIATVEASLEKVTKEWPYHAARIDLEILMSPGGKPIPLLDAESMSGILRRMEETRPIHVLLRALTLVFELRDTFGEDGASGATDKTGCTSRLEDVRTGQPFPGTPGRNFQYIADQGADAGDEMTVERLDLGGARTELEATFDEQAQIVCPLDSLIINTGGPDAYY
jgi:hypothetical protein